ncbi:cell wall metabolism sensor histidine kinase WalK [Rothia sp. ZJ932]|uniref:sensor histidine kinase n=1 Tax=Rothia sp. ZJ932 TaxID=2810516 RepID=UPI0019681D0C|nr:ATP-binding protein [Rothia sp. ZJ932]QRZ61909.1 HAMP domain-containing protein [Rothia sp. ZJ932]
MKNRILRSRLGSLSLRTQLVVLSSLLIALAISVTALVAISAMRSQLASQLDDEILSNSRVITGNLLPTEDRTIDTTPRLAYTAYLLNAEGNVVHQFSTANRADSAPEIGRWNREAVLRYTETGFTVPSVSGHTQWRIMPLSTDSEEYSVLIASPLTQSNATLALVGTLTIAFGMATLFAAIAMNWVLVTRAFEPLARVEQTAAKIASGDLSQRITNYNPYTELGHLSTSLNQMLAHIEEAFDTRKHSEEKMRRFVGDASHELRTPLVSIRGYSELYRHGALQNPEDVGKAMARIESESKRMGQLVEDLLTLARIDERRVNENTVVDLLKLAQDAAADAFATAPERDVEVVGVHDPDEEAVSAPVMGDESRLRQVVANLMTNAIRYTPEGTPLEIAVGAEKDARGNLLSVLKVRDHGPGIHGEDREKVFQRFYRADTSRTRETGGTGLGLAIVAAIIAQHDGSISIEDTAGGGATFVMKIPAHIP